MIPGTTEYQAHVRFLEHGKMRRFETPVWSQSFVSAAQAASKLLFTHHQDAVIIGLELIDTALKESTAPKLIVSNPKLPPKRPA